MKLNLGCGNKILKDFINVDLFIKHPLITNMDISKLSFEDNSCDEILAEDIIEHFPRLKWKQVMSEWIRVLKPDGLIHLQFPEMKLLSYELINSNSYEEWEKINRRIFGGQGDGMNSGEGMFHYTGFSFEYMKEHLELNHNMIYVSHKFHNLNCYLTMKKEK